MNDSCPPGWPILPNVPHPIGFLPLPPPTAGQSTTSATKPALLHEHHSSLHTTNLTQNYGSAEPSPLARKLPLDRSPPRGATDHERHRRRDLGDVQRAEPDSPGKAP